MRIINIFFYAHFDQLLFSFVLFSDQATLSSILQVNVWQRPQSKKKSKKRNLVASEHEQSKFLVRHFISIQRFIDATSRA